MSYTFPIIYPVACHTDNVGQGTIFVAMPGTKTHGVQFIMDAVNKGATGVVVPQDVQLEPALISFLESRGVELEYAANIRERFAELSAEKNEYPADQLHIIAITGTKGKTTTSFIIRHLLHEAGFNTALIGTVQNQIGEHILPQTLTTPHADYLHVFLAECVREGVTHVIMEVSAQALTLGRVHGIQFGGVVFTNFSQEHAEFYATQDEYFDAKCRLFEQIGITAPIVLNADDEWHCTIRDRHYEKGCRCDESCYLGNIIYVSKHDDTEEADGYQSKKYCDFRVIHSSMEDGLSLVVNTQELRCPKLVGIFNAYNIAMAFALCRDLGIDVEIIQQSLANFPGVKGRMQTYQLPNGAQCIIDHAHTPSSFEAVLSTLRTHTIDLIVVFGIGGNRDTIKRPILGAIAAKYADSVVLTTDNPRNEEPENIIEDIKRGISAELMPKVQVILDREQAIKYAYSISQEGSIIALLAKGSDEYQEIKGIKYPFIEREIVERLSD